MFSIIYKESRKEMTYKIDYETKDGKWKRVFDIEFSLAYSESNRTKKEWYYVKSIKSMRKRIGPDLLLA